MRLAPRVQWMHRSALRRAQSPNWLSIPTITIHQRVCLDGPAIGHNSDDATNTRSLNQLDISAQRYAKQSAHLLMPCQ